MQHHVVAGVGDGAEYCALIGTGRLQQGQSLVAVAGEHHIIEALAAGRAEHGHAAFVTADTVNRAVEADALGEWLAQRRQVTA
ncbi:hypothetical protein D3C75_1123310 [compost metagenome]